MSVFIASINSGSNGNCYYIGNENEAVLIDAGISCRETEKRMRRMGLKMDMVKAIFISHEHTDHIYGAEVLAGRYELPVYITPPTLKGSRSKPPAHLIRHFAAHEPVTIGRIKITAFPKLHDAADPHSFVIDTGGVCTGVFTDIGAPCEHVSQYFTRCHAIFLEANYDETMLENGRYAPHLKQRIRSDKGHLSNDQALQLFITHKPPFMSHVFLSHLSKDNNKPEIVQQLFSAHAGKTIITVAPRHIETPVYRLGTPTPNPTAPIRYVQSSLF
ncbi:MAG: MBL fold metallo-hydrolase [Taibaiella sp.]|nr:MBL fold metallo-hydrolase [Taibaiella sp.]